MLPVDILPIIINQYKVTFSDLLSFSRFRVTQIFQSLKLIQTQLEGKFKKDWLGYTPNGGQSPTWALWDCCFLLLRIMMAGNALARVQLLHQPVDFRVYRKIASANMSRYETHAGFFRQCVS